MRPTARSPTCRPLSTHRSTIPDVVRGWELDPVTFALAVPGEHDRRNAATAREALVRRGRCACGGGGPGPVRGRPSLPARGTRGGVTVIDDYGHDPTSSAPRSTARGEPRAAWSRCTSRTSWSGRAPLPRAGDALRLADIAIVTDFVGQQHAARGRDRPPRPRRGPGRHATRLGADASRTRLGSRSCSSAGDLVVTLGVGAVARRACDRRGPSDFVGKA